MTAQPKILVYSPKQAEGYAKCIREAGFASVSVAATPVEAEKQLPTTEVILGWNFPTQLLSKPLASSVRWFQSTGAGVNDLVADSTIPKNIKLTRIVDQFGSYISEYVFTYLLYIMKNVPRMTNAQKNKNWDPFISESLADKTIGVAGLGSIGAEVVRKARAFDMKVHGLSFSGKNARLVDRHFLAEEWKEFVQDIDFLVLTLPLTDSSYNVINKEILLAMKPDACLINVGRGALINEVDLLNVINTGHLKAAILDVFETEPLPSDHPFYSMPNVYISSHLSGPSTVEGVSQFFINNLKRYMNNQPLHGLVNRKRGY